MTLKEQNILNQADLTIIRFKNADIENRIEWVLKKIQVVVDPFPLGGNKKGGNSIKKDSPNLVKLT